MAASPKFLEAYKKSTGQLVEKPGNAEHSAKFDRCVAHVQSQGTGKNAYAVCTAALGGEAFKSMDAASPDFLKEVDTFIRTLGIAGAGPVPHSLLSAQDLEPTRTTTTRKGIVRKSQDLQKAGDKRYIVRCSGTDWGCYDKKSDAQEALDYLTSQGTFAVLVEETVLDSAEKGVVETTGKQLDTAVKQATKIETSKQADNLVGRIKNIQLDRQKATIAERSKSIGKGRTFKDVWGGLSARK